MEVPPKSPKVHVVGDRPKSLFPIRIPNCQLTFLGGYRRAFPGPFPSPFGTSVADRDLSRDLDTSLFSSSLSGQRVIHEAPPTAETSGPQSHKTTYANRIGGRIAATTSHLSYGRLGAVPHLFPQAQCGHGGT